MKYFRALLILLGIAATTACTLNPATGQRQFSLIGEQQEIAMGREYAKNVQAEIGFYDDEALQQYVQKVGKELAAQTERPNLPWEFHVVDDPGVNAFALPGGYIFITRGILAHFNSEAEMASVLGHEIGHVTARHSVEQMSRAQLAQLGLGVAMVASEEFRNYAGLAQMGLGVLFLKFSRDDESQADHLGLRYLMRDGYDADEMPRVFDMLKRQTEMAGGSRLPEWQSTHPSPEHRSAKLHQEIEKLGGSPPGARVRRDEYLQHLRGLVFGPDPREGYVAGRTFYHPGMAFRMDFPKGWKIANQRQMVAALSPEKDAVIILSLAGAQDPSAAAQKFFEQAGMKNLGRRGRGRFDFQIDPSTDPSGQPQPGARGEVAFIPHQGRVFQLVGYTRPGDFSHYSRVIHPALGSFRKLTDPAHLNVKPKRIQLIRIKHDMRLGEFNRRHPSTVSLEELALLNGVGTETLLKAGTLVKRVSGKSPPKR